MQFPEKPTCHPPMGSVFRYGNEFAWSPPRPTDHLANEKHVSYHARHCDFCGSIHPEDLLKIENLALQVADFKYGWPHKFYIGGTLNGKEIWGKWYNAHLEDEGLDQEAFDKIADIIIVKTGIAFNRRLDEQGRTRLVWACA